MKYRRVTPEMRLLLKAYLDEGFNQSQIAVKLAVDRSTISRELTRNRGGRGYRPKQSQQKCEGRQRFRRDLRKLIGPLVEIVENRLSLKWSPEQISQRLRFEKTASISAEAIYQHVRRDRDKGGELWRNLRRSGRQRRRRFPSGNRQGQIKNATPIARRPAGVESRRRFGHWERDTMIGGDRKTCILALVERKSRFNIFLKLNRRLAPKVAEKTVKALQKLPCKSITNDRGHEFAAHEIVAQQLKVQVYFCDPYTSSQRGTNENRIGILRQYFPKKTCLKGLHWKQLKKVEFEINNRPMKCLGWRTPHEVINRKVLH